MTHRAVRLPHDPLAVAATAASAGSAEAFEQIIEETSDELYRLSARVIGDLDDADDVLQDSFLRAFAALRRGEYQGRSTVRTWLYRITLNVALNARRARLRGEVSPEKWRAAPEESPERLDARVQLRELAGWMRELPEQQYAALVLKELEGLSVARISEVLECSPGAVEQRLVRARASLRERASHD